MFIDRVLGRCNFQNWHSNWKIFYSFFFSLNGFLGLLNILSTNELQKKKEKKFGIFGIYPGASESGVRRYTNWATRAKLTGQ